MPVTLSHEAPDFERRFAALLDMKRESSADVDAAVAAIIEDVATRGLDAVLALTRRFDRWDVTEATLAFTEAEIDAAIAAVPAPEMAALELAAERITAYHARQLPEDEMWEDAAGVTLGWRWTAVDAAGLYVPGGLASYPSSVLMNAIPAQVAGVGRIEVCAPTPDGRFNPLVLAAARLGGVGRVWRIGGAQAIAAMAYGAGPIRPVDKITGPGNAYVAAAKRRVFGRVGIDMIAGPSEILVIADADNDPDWIATDLMSQAEHDESAQAILITTDAGFGEAVLRAVERLLQRLERTAIAGASWRDFGAVVVAKDLAQSAELANRIAPEHLELCVADPERLMGEIRHAGAIFLG
ncbi:MAG: histidinol dehydrogenase, partial [Thermohalobaculum sp.]|nr:histidinol dehydrogenase [Thermohalobaculum sp.]